MSAKHQPGQPWGDEFSASGMKATSDCTQKQMLTIQLSLLFCMPEKTGQFTAIMASGLGNPSRNASESWLAQKGMMRSPQLRSQCCQILLCSSENLGMCQLTANSKPSLMAHSDTVELKDSEEIL